MWGTFAIMVITIGLNRNNNSLREINRFRLVFDPWSQWLNVKALDGFELPEGLTGIVGSNPTWVIFFFLRLEFNLNNSTTHANLYLFVKIKYIIFIIFERWLSSCHKSECNTALYIHMWGTFAIMVITIGLNRNNNSLSEINRFSLIFDPWSQWLNG